MEGKEKLHPVHSGTTTLRLGVVQSSIFSDRTPVGLGIFFGVRGSTTRGEKKKKVTAFRFAHRDVW